MARKIRMSKAVRIGVTVAVLLAVWHILWAVLVAAGWAQPILDFVFRMHFIQPAYTVLPFDLTASAVLAAIMAAIGFVAGYLVTFVWTWLGSKAPLFIRDARTGQWRRAG
jgi:hypothetical protein